MSEWINIDVLFKYCVSRVSAWGSRGRIVPGNVEESKAEDTKPSISHSLWEGTQKHPESVVLLIISLYVCESSVCLIQQHLQQAVYQAAFKGTPPHRFMCNIALITPQSRGWRKLDSTVVPGRPQQAAPLLGWKAQREDVRQQELWLSPWATPSLEAYLFLKQLSLKEKRTHTRISESFTYFTHKNIILCVIC